MNITICIGSSCHIKGSRQIVEELQKLIEDNNLKDKIELNGSFCMENCQNGVCLKIDEEFFSLKPENVNEFFNKEVISRL